MNVSPKICPECGHRFPPDAPEPSFCPDCRWQCTGYGESEEAKSTIPDDMPVTPEERARWRRGFWVFLFIGPLFAVVFTSFRQDILSSVPPSLRDFAWVGSQPFVPLSLSTAGAGFCLANVWFTRRRFMDKLAYAFLIAFLLMGGYGLIALMVIDLGL